MDGKAVQLTLRELRTTFSSPMALSAMAAVVLVLGVSGPFGTQERLNLAERLVYWLVVVISSTSVCFSTIYLVNQLLKPRIASPNLRIGIGAVLAGTLVTGLMALIDTIALGKTVVDYLPQLWLNCVVITLAVSLIGVQLRRKTAPAAATAPPVSALRPTPPPILERVPLPQRGALWALVVEDHYVEVLTERGKTLVLLRLSDAIRETAGVPGVQIHRSHWVALAAVSRVVRSDGKVFAELPNGLRLPVSRGFADAAKAAGIV